jgi:pimeloyl-ACP methyl ester carboxylesterase/DNA-binding CsgD family transcriptional regulator
MSVTGSGGGRKAPPQQIRFCRGQGGVRLAYATHGSGPPLIVVSCWLSHLQHDWESPVWRHFLEDLGGVSTLIRYDERGFGLSEWTVDDFSLDARVADLEAVVASVGVERFALLGMSGGSSVALEYALRHPDRVSRMIMYGGSCYGAPDYFPEPPEEEVAFRAMIRAGWAKPDPIFRRVFTTMFIPGATEEQLAWFDELQRMSTSTDNMLQSRIERQRIDLRDRVHAIRTPTLVLSAVDDRCVPFDEGLDLASRVPGARLVPLESPNHILLADEPAWRTFMAEVSAFLEPDRMAYSVDAAGDVLQLSARQREIIGLAAGGSSNLEIAARLGLSARTVERHLSNAYLKLGLAGRSARTAAVAAYLRAAR